MDGETISESSFKAVINAPIEKVDLADWVFGLPDAKSTLGQARIPTT